MRNNGRSFVAMAGTATVVGQLTLAAQPQAQGGAEIPRQAGKPNLNGIWQAINTAYWNVEDHPAMPGLGSIGTFGAIPPGQGVVEGGEIPYKPEAKKQREENLKNRFKEDPEAKCYM